MSGHASLTVVTTRAWFQRLKGVLFGVLTGLALIVAALSDARFTRLVTEHPTMNKNDSAIRTYPSSVRCLLAGAARRACMLAAGLMLALPAMAQTTRYVAPLHPDSDDGANTCANPDIPCETISHAVDVASSDDVIDIAGAIYTETLEIDKSLSLHGAGEGVTVIQAHENPGEATSRVITIDGQYEVEIADLTIRHGVVTTIPDNLGGGIYANGPTLTVTRVAITGNMAVGANSSAGGMYLGNGSTILTNVTFSENESGSVGGGLNRSGGTLTLTEVTFSDNTANEDGGGFRNFGFATLSDVVFTGNVAGNRGGGMYNFNSSPSLTNVIFGGNEAGASGGGMYNAGDGSPTLSAAVFGGNTAAIVGGGMANNGSNTPELTNVLFFGNTAGINGGGLWNRSGDPALTQVFFVENACDQKGGGLYVDAGGAPTLRNVIYSGNAAGEEGGGSFLFDSSSAVLTNVVYIGNAADLSGGGMHNEGGDITLTNVTLSGNATIGGGGGAMYNLGGSQTLTNVIIWNNAADGSTTSASASIFNDGGIAEPAISYSLIANSGGSSGWDPDIGVDGGNNLDDDPLFVETSDPGDAPAASAGDPHLTEGSPAIDAGDPDTDPLIFPTDGEGEPIDGDGNPRFFNTVIDMGAFEWRPLADEIFSDRFE